MEMMAPFFTITIKAPHQKLEDYKIHCERSWTVLKLKEHISETYPGKPRPNHQKLIYSGHLLRDEQTLDDVFSRDNNEENHTLHLVCISKEPQETPTTQASNASSSSSATHLSQNAAATPSPSLPSMVPPFQPGANFYEALAAGGGLNPEQMAQQMAFMQQMYTQYMTAYLQYTQAPGIVAAAPPSAAPPAVPAVNPPAQPPMERRGVGGDPFLRADDDDDELGAGNNRDWLDWFYISSRAIVLFSIIYFYSSPARFVLVLVTAFLLYLYQIGFFRYPQQRQAAAQQPQEAQRQPVQPPPQDLQDDRAAEGDEAQEILAAMDGNQGPPQNHNIPQQPAPGALETIWSFIVSFFSSLIPEHPPPINAN